MVQDGVTASVEVSKRCAPNSKSGKALSHVRNDAILLGNLDRLQQLFLGAPVGPDASLLVEFACTNAMQSQAGRLVSRSF